jgi:hypothetical protein
MQPIKLESLRELVEAGAVTSVQIVGQKGGFAVVASVGPQQRPLGTRRGDVRVFTAADTAIKTLREMGMMQFSMDVTHYQAGTLRAARSDNAVRHGKAREALEHDRWFRDQVQTSLAKVENGTAEYIEHEALWNELEAHVRARVAEHDAGKTKAASRRKAR